MDLYSLICSVWTYSAIFWAYDVGLVSHFPMHARNVHYNSGNVTYPGSVYRNTVWLVSSLLYISSHRLLAPGCYSGAVSSSSLVHISQSKTSRLTMASNHHRLRSSEDKRDHYLLSFSFVKDAIPGKNSRVWLTSTRFDFAQFKLEARSLAVFPAICRCWVGTITFTWP